MCRPFCLTAPSSRGSKKRPCPKTSSRCVPHRDRPPTRPNKLPRLGQLDRPGCRRHLVGLRSRTQPTRPRLVRKRSRAQRTSAPGQPKPGLAESASTPGPQQPIALTLRPAPARSGRYVVPKRHSVATIPLASRPREQKPLTRPNHRRLTCQAHETRGRIGSGELYRASKKQIPPQRPKSGVR